MSKINELESNTYKCKQCGNNLTFDIKTNSLLCVSCNNKIDIIDKNDFSKHNFNDTESVEQVEKYKFITNDCDNFLFKCNNCGADIVLDEYEISKKCPYCASSNVVKNDELKGLPIDAIVKFRKTKEEAISIFQKEIKKRFFIPNNVKKNLPLKSVEAYYSPSFGFDCSTISNYDGVFYNLETENINGKLVTNTIYFNVKGTLNSNFKDVLIESSNKINQSQLNDLLPFNCEKSVSYSDEYLSGFEATSYDTKFGANYLKSKKVVDERIYRQILQKHPADGVQKLNISTSYKDNKYCYYLLPLYRFNIDYKGKKYISYMNGQSGKMGRKGLPISMAKVATVGITVAIFIITLIVLLICVSK